MPNNATLRVLFGDEKARDIVDALNSLKQKKAGITVQIQHAGGIEPEKVPMPLAEYTGKTTRIHEYGHDAVLALIRDVNNGNVK